MKVLQASLRRVVEREGKASAEVEVQTNQETKPVLLAYFSQADADDYDMNAVISNHAETEIDWYDNNLHAAFTDESESFSQNGFGEWEAFKEQILSWGDIRKELAEALRS